MKLLKPLVFPDASEQATATPEIIPIARGGTGTTTEPTIGQVPVFNGTSYEPATVAASGASLNAKTALFAQIYS